MSVDATKNKLIRRRVLIGTASNFTGQIFVFLVSFLLTPFILNQLGATIYGLWILLGSIVAYSSIMDFGIWGTVIKYVAEFQAQENYDEARSLLSTVLYCYVAIAALISLLGIVIAPFLPRLFELSPEQYTLASQLIVLIGFATGLGIPCMLPLAILRGLQRYDIVNSIDISTTLITSVATVVVLLTGGGVLGLALISIGGLFLSLVAGIWVLRRVAPEVEIQWRGANWPMARKIFNYSWPLFTRDIATRLQTRTDEITIGVFLPVSAVGSYNIARRLSETTQTLTRQFMKTLLPLASQLHAEDDFPRLRSLYKVGTRFTLAIVLALSSILFVLAGPIMAVWVGSPYAAYAGLVVILTLANLVATVQWPSMAILQAMTRHRILAISSLGNGLANLALSILLVRPYGLVGVALGTTIPTMIEYFFVILPYSLRVTGIKLREAWLEIFMPALVPALPMLLILYLSKIAFEPTSLLAIMVVSTVGLAVYATVYLSVGASEMERQWVADMALFGYRFVTMDRKHVDG
jgi:O-antigen/teichoic acid export membrane protein